MEEETGGGYYFFCYFNGTDYFSSFSFPFPGATFIFGADYFIAAAVY